MVYSLNDTCILFYEVIHKILHFVKKEKKTKLKQTKTYVKKTMVDKF